MVWNPDQYLKFAEPRLRPAVDLLSRVPNAKPLSVCDLGCGTGNVTKILLDRWPKASFTGVDDSPEMLAKATRELPQVRWVNNSIATWRPELPFDILYSNAALHWLTNHALLFPQLMSFVADDGVLAVQMPRNFLAPSHTLIAETARAGTWHGKLKHLLIPPPVAEPSFYFRALTPLARSLDIWETEYSHVLEGPDPVKEWVKGTWLKQFLDALDPTERPEFEADYANRLRIAYPPQPDGKTLFPFRQLFIVAHK